MATVLGATCNSVIKTGQIRELFSVPECSPATNEVQLTNMLGFESENELLRMNTIGSNILTLPIVSSQKLTLAQPVLSSKRFFLA